MRIQYAARLAAGAVLAALLVGSTATSGASAVAPVTALPAHGHTTSEWLMMGPTCGASTT